MTVKSAGRIHRDAQAAALKEHSKDLQKNNCWSDLKEIYISTAQALHSHFALAAFANDKELLSYVVDKVTMNNNLRMLARDLTQLSGELAEIYAQHKNKDGHPVDSDEVMNSITIFEQYQLFMSRHEAVIMPTIYHITEGFDQARNRMLVAHEAANQTQATDVTIVTDVVFAETPVPTIQ